MRKVFLDNLPCDNRGFVSWKQSVGHKLKFIYDEVDGELEIIKYDPTNYHVVVVYENSEQSIFVGDLSASKITYIIGKQTREFLYRIGEVIEINKSKLRVLDQIRIPTGSLNRMLKGYKYQCMDCGDVREKTEDEIKRNGCGVCSGIEVLKGYNDIWTTDPELGKMLWNPDDGYNYSSGSSKKVDFKCLDCGFRIKNKIIANVNRQKISCPRCSDGKSYPEKFICNLLFQLERTFVNNNSFKWSNNKKYDFYDENLNLIIETHGMQHYEHTGFNRSVAEEQKNDKYKYDLAIKNNIKYYVVIDCRYSEIEWIKNSILNSKLSYLFDLNNIDWLKCHKYACGSLIKTVCELWNSGTKNTQEISDLVKINRSLVSKYLQKGALIGWCDYNVDEERKKGYVKSGIIIANMNRVPIVQLTLDDEYVSEFMSVKCAAGHFKVSEGAISNVLNGKSNTSCGFRWIRKEDYDKQIKKVR